MIELSTGSTYHQRMTSIIPRRILGEKSNRFVTAIVSPELRVICVQNNFIPAQKFQILKSEIVIEIEIKRILHLVVYNNGILDAKHRKTSRCLSRTQN